MILLWREINNGPFRVVEVATREEAVKHEPFIVFPDVSSAENLRNHLSGHDAWPKKDCPVCRPAADPIPEAAAAPAPDDALVASQRLRRKDAK